MRPNTRSARRMRNLRSNGEPACRHSRFLPASSRDRKRRSSLAQPTPLRKSSNLGRCINIVSARMRSRNLSRRLWLLAGGLIKAWHLESCESTANFLFFGRLKDFLHRDQRDQSIPVRFRGRQSIKHLAESLGVPHPEIGQVHVNGQEGKLSSITQDGDRIEVYPVPNGSPVEPRFLLDNHLGRLAAYLRMLGFDCLYQNDYDDVELAGILQWDERILLSRDRRLLMRKVVTHGYCLRSLDSL